MFRRIPGFVLILGVAGATCLAQKPPVSGPDPKLPKVVLLGDSIRMGYAPLVAKRLAGVATVISSTANGGDSANLLRHLPEWAIQEKPAVVHFNCGIHDLKFFKKTGQHQVELAQYQSNLRQIVAQLKETSAAIVFAATTPLIQQRRAGSKAEHVLQEADTHRYNAAAIAVMQECGVPVHDLYWLVEHEGAEKLLAGDGVHFTPEGNEKLAEAVADSILRQLSILAISRHFRGHASGPAGAEGAARYRKAQAQRDAQVPSAFKKLPVKAFPVPSSAEVWKRQRPELLQKVIGSMGELPPRPSPQKVRVVAREVRRGYTLERVAIDNGVDSQISAIVLIPEKRQNPAPAVLWLHSSTPDKSYLLAPDGSGGAEPLGEALVHAGYVVLAPDAYWYGDRGDQTPGGPAETYRLASRETYRLAEDSLVKFNLWFGRTLWGMMVRDDQISLDYLCARPEVDKARIGCTGMSMGSTRSWWLAAVDDRIAATVGVACLTRYQNLIAHGELRAHGVYYFVYGLLKHFDTEGVIAMIAPRPFLALTGDLDHGSPADGARVIEQQAGAVYRALGASDRFKSILYQDTGHVYTPEMRAEMLAWFARWLKPARDRNTTP